MFTVSQMRELCKTELRAGQASGTVVSSRCVCREGAPALHIKLVGSDMSGCDDHIGAQQAELVTGLRPGTKK